MKRNLKTLSWVAMMLLLLVSIPRPVVAPAAIAKTQNTELLGWTEVAQNSIQQSAVFDTSQSYASGIAVITALSSTTAHTGTEVIILKGSSTADDDWTEVTRYVCCIGTAFKSDFAGDEAAGQNVLSITNPATGNLDHDAKWVFIEHTGTIANCEIAYQTANSGDAGDTITVLDVTTHAQTAADSDVYTCDAAVSAVDTRSIQVAADGSRYKVIWNNKYDADGSTVHVMARGTKMTGI